MIASELDRKITLAQSIMERLDSNEQLSNVLSQVRLLMGMTGKSVMVALIDILIHGLTNVPYQRIPFTDEAYKQAGIIYMKLCGIQDTSKLDIDEMARGTMEGSQREIIPRKNHTVNLSVYQIENLQPPPPVKPTDGYKFANLMFQQTVFFDETKSILARLRAYIYDYVSKIWIESTREKDRIDLLGPDYRFITDKLDTLETPVGDELLAAVDNLRSTNPASWGASALLCRNVVIKLAKILWKVTEQTYVMTSGETLEVSKKKEKNILLAYIDAFSKKVTPDKQSMLDEAKGLVHPIYDIGSKGKHLVRREEAQALLVNTFNFVDLLDKATELEPIDTLS